MGNTDGPNQRTKLIIAGGLAVVALLAICVLAGGAAFVAIRASGGFAGEPTSRPSPTDNESFPSVTPQATSTDLPLTTLTATPVPPTSTTTPSPTATRHPATWTPAPPTATNTPTPLADLTCYGLDHGGTNSVGKQTFLIHYANRGTAAAEAGSYISWLPIGPDGPMNAELFVRQEIDAGGSATLIHTVELEPGSYTMRFLMDATNVVQESDETNNICEVSFSVSPFGVTLVPSTLAAP